MDLGEWLRRPRQVLGRRPEDLGERLEFWRDPEFWRTYRDRLMRSEMISGAVQAYEAPGKAWRGELDPSDPLSVLAANEVALSALGGGTAFGVVPAGGVGMFAGRSAKTANLGMLNLAKEMKKAGKTRDEIWNATGWFKGPEGKWKFEIPDNEALLLRDLTPDVVAGKPKLSDVLWHEKAYEAYPETAKFRLREEPSNAPASFNPAWGRHGGIGVKTGVGPEWSYFPKPSESSLLHEMQHGVQDFEGFARGGSPETAGITLDEVINDLRKRAQALFKQSNSPEVAAKGGYWKLREEGMALEKQARDLESVRVINNFAPYEAYRRLAGEAEARAVQSRMNMTHAERQAVPPWQSYDTPWDQLIVK